jgi:hypothetical protein
MFRNACSQEWAIGSSSITNPAPANSACLSKENPQDGVVLFKDNCTGEWAMNPQPDNNARRSIAVGDAEIADGVELAVAVALAAR